MSDLKSGPVFVKEQVEAFKKRWDRAGGRPPNPVDLSAIERAMLLLHAVSDPEPSSRILRGWWEP
ncbi:hypothetical protein [Streptomyces wuyuanensis]|uniref:hypothetical protein n=1 Tax=Streptomyces wuyuanensis TaxID=1196353 RepID=UPI00341A8D05